MPRPRHTVPSVIKDLRYNPVSCKYEISVSGVTYSMGIEQTRLLKEYFRGYSFVSDRCCSDWYNKLDNKTKKEVLRTGNIQMNNDF